MNENLHALYIHARDVVKGRVRSIETKICKDAQIAYFYARDVIKGRFWLGEFSIMNDWKFAFLYAKNIIKGRWERAEFKILQGGFAKEYLARFYGFKFRKGELID